MEILDGATGTWLFKHGVPEDKQIWSASAIANPKHHKSVVKCHLAYIKANASVITTNNYAMQPVYYKKKFGDGWQKLMKKHIQLAGQLAMKAKIVGKRPEVRIQGCLPPCCESLRPDLCKEYLDDERNYRTATDFYRLTVELLDPYVDIWILETMNSEQEVKCALTALYDTNKPIRICFQAAFFDPLTMACTPEKIEDAAKFVIDLKETQDMNIDMFGINCGPLEIVEETMACLTEETKGRLKLNEIKLGAYANGTDVKVVKTKRFSVDDTEGRGDRFRVIENDEFLRHTKKLWQLGVECVGGCCGITDPTIKEISQLDPTASMNYSIFKHPFIAKNWRRIGPKL